MARFQSNRFTNTLPTQQSPLPKVDLLPSQSNFTNERVELHKYLLKRLNLAAVDTLSREELAKECYPVVQNYANKKGLALNKEELDQLTHGIIDELLGLGPIEPLLADETISDILINGHETVYVERRGKLERAAIAFSDEAHLMRIIGRIVAAIGRRVDESSPLVDARLADGSRVNVAIRPVAIDGPLVSIRKFSKNKLTLEKLVSFGALSEEMLTLLAGAVRGKISIVISGGTGSGKTTILNALSSFIPHDERLITIEDAAELQLQQPHVGRMETRPPSIDGKGEIRQRELLKNALRMRPDRIIVGEVRGEEAFDMLQALNTGHAGSMTTIHANSPRDAVSRIEQMVGMADMPMSQESVRQQIASAVTIVIQSQRLSDGSRRITSITELTGMEGDVVQMQEIMGFRKLGLDANGRILGHHVATGIRPAFLKALSEVGIEFPVQIFNPDHISGGPNNVDQ